MVSVPFLTVVSASIVITIACTVTTVLRVGSLSSKNTWGSRDFFSKDTSIPTPTSGDLLQSAPSSSSAAQFSAPSAFYVPSPVQNNNYDYLSPAISLAYILTGLSLATNTTTSSTSISSSEQIDLVNNLMKQMNSSQNFGTAWTNVVNTSVGFSALLELGVVSANISASTSWNNEAQTTVNLDSVAFVERSIGIDGAPVVVLTQQESNFNNVCVWKIITGFTPSTFSMIDISSAGSIVDDNSSKLSSPISVKRSDVYKQWSCQDSANPKRLSNLAIAFRRKKSGG